MKGKIVNQSNEPVADVTLQSYQNLFKTSSNKKGEFVISDIRSGSFKIRVSRIGYISFDTTLDIKPNIDILLKITEKYISTKQIVITGTKTGKDISSDPIHTDVISDEDLRAKASSTLGDAIADQIGLSVIDIADKNKGVQLQGLDPAYTLILVNGEPVIGRSMGAISLDRLSMGQYQKN